MLLFCNITTTFLQADVLALLEARQLHWAYWFWRDSWGQQHCVKQVPGLGEGYGYAVICKLDNGTVHHNAGALAALGKYIGPQGEL